MTKKSKRGGDRTGAGRKKTGVNTVTVSFSVHKDFATVVKATVKAKVTELKELQAKANGESEPLVVVFSPTGKIEAETAAPDHETTVATKDKVKKTAQKNPVSEVNITKAPESTLLEKHKAELAGITGKGSLAMQRRKYLTQEITKLEK